MVTINVILTSPRNTDDEIQVTLSLPEGYSYTQFFTALKESLGSNVYRYDLSEVF
jgi:hypothetical protein